MRQSLSQRQKAQENFYGSPELTEELILMVVKSGKTPKLHGASVMREEDMPDYWGQLDPATTLPFDFEDEEPEE